MQNALSSDAARPDWQPALTLATPRRQGLFGRLLQRPVTWVRRHERFGCCFVAVLEIVDKGVPLDGLVTDLSQGGLLFRPASLFIFDRREAEVEVRTGDEALAGEIVSVRSTGYGVRFRNDISTIHLESLIAQFGLASGESG